MSQGGIFNLLLEDERNDKFLTASNYLQTRITDIISKRKTANKKDVMPTFADIAATHLCYLKSSFQPYVSVVSEYVKIMPTGDVTDSISASGGNIEFELKTTGQFTNDIVLRLRVAAIGSPTATTPSAETPLFRYCSFPGARILNKVTFKSKTAIIDEYSRDDLMNISKFFVESNHRTGWERCMGQQEQKEATFFGNGFTGSYLYRDGQQTPKLYHDSFDMLIPLKFWFCEDASESLLNDMIPNSERKIICEMAPLEEIVKALVPNVNNPSILDEVPLPFSRLRLSAELYVNNLFINTSVYEIFQARTVMNLIRVHKSQTASNLNQSGSIKLLNLKYPTEFLMTGFRSRNNSKNFDKWWLMGKQKTRTNSNKLLAPAIVWNSALNNSQLVVREAVEVSTLENVVDTLGITSNGINLYSDLPSSFYNSYIPIKYPKHNVMVSPCDNSMFMINFNLYPGKFNPSGYYNMSTGREITINYKFLPANSYNDIEMITTSRAINFLIRRGDTLCLLYAL